MMKIRSFTSRAAFSNLLKPFFNPFFDPFWIFFEPYRRILIQGQILMYQWNWSPPWAKLLFFEIFFISIFSVSY